MSRHVMVTGGSRGLGLTIVSHLLAGGYSVTSVSRRTTQQLRELSGAHPNKLEILEGDISNSAVLPGLMDRASAKKGLFGLINNAAVARDGLLVMTGVDAVCEMIAVNLQACVVLSRLAAKVMIPVRSGAIINISSVVAHRAQRGLGVYTATKAGIEGFTRAMARELSPRGITVNAIAPGLLPTEMTSIVRDEERRAILRRTLSQRPVTCDDVAAVVLFLLSPAAQMITGAIIPVDGGAGL